VLSVHNKNKNNSEQKSKIQKLSFREIKDFLYIRFFNFLIFKVNFPLEQRYKDELKFYYGDLVEIIPLDFTRRPISTMRIMNRYIYTLYRLLYVYVYVDMLKIISLDSTKRPISTTSVI